MSKKTVIALALLILAIVAWGLLIEAVTTRTIMGGQELIGPLKGIIGTHGLITDLAALLLAAFILLFVFAGIGMVMLFGVIVAGLILAGLAFPILLVLLFPLVVVWLFISAIRSGPK